MQQFEVALAKVIGTEAASQLATKEIAKTYDKMTSKQVPSEVFVLEPRQRFCCHLHQEANHTVRVTDRHQFLAIVGKNQLTALNELVDGVPQLKFFAEKLDVFTVPLGFFSVVKLALQGYPPSREIYS